MLVVLLLPLGLALVTQVVRDPVSPGGDESIVELRVRDVGTSVTPAVGSYSRFGANHPGPAWFYVLVVPYRLLGSDHAALAAGTLIAGMASLVAIALIVKRLGGMTLMIVAAAMLAVFVHSLGLSLVSSPWEPTGLILPCAALLFLTLAAVEGTHLALPLVGAVACVLAQAQGTLAVFALAMGGLAVAASLVRLARVPDERRREVIALGLTATLVLALWAPPLVQQVRGDPGNLTAFLRSIRDVDLPTLGLGPAWRLTAGQLGAGGGWLGTDLPLHARTAVVDTAALPLLPLAVLPMIAGLVLSARDRSARPARSLAGVVLVACAAAVASLSQLVGDLFLWIPSWTQVLGFGAWLAVGWCAIVLVRRWSPPVADRIVPAALLVPLLLASLATSKAALDTPDAPPLTIAVQALVEPTLAHLSGPVLVDSTVEHDTILGGTRLGLPELVLALDR
ncbi:MAG: hypothetical protein ABWZ52_02985, partial [Acidimicrobiales bacterium]